MTDPDSSALRSMVRSRGLKLARANPTDDLLLPPSGTGEDLAAYRQVLDHYAARLLLKEVINAGTGQKWGRGRRQVERFCDPGAVDGFLDRFRDLGVIRLTKGGVPTTVKAVSSFGTTCEWYTSRVLWEDFSCPSAWGAVFENTPSGGDHDVVASLSGRFLYMEVKTSPPGRIEAPEIGGFLRRLSDICPDIAVFYNDTHLRMKDKIVPMMEEALGLSGHRKPQSGVQFGENFLFERVEREIFHLSGSLYAMNSKPNLTRNLEVVFRHYFRSRSAISRMTDGKE